MVAPSMTARYVADRERTPAARVTYLEPGWRERRAAFVLLDLSAGDPERAISALRDAAAELEEVQQ